MSGGTHLAILAFQLVALVAAGWHSWRDWKRTREFKSRSDAYCQFIFGKLRQMGVPVRIPPRHLERERDRRFN